MPRGNPNIKPRWKKGESGNPKGRPVSTPEQLRLTRLTKTELTEIGSYIVKGDKTELKKIVDDPTTSILKSWIASIAIKGIASGDMDALNKLLERIVGKVKEEVEVSGNAVSVVVGLPSNGSEKKKDG